MCSISGKLITSKVFGADKAKLVYDKSKGRYLRATEAFKEGDGIINENAACGVLLEDKIEPKYCHYCFKIVNQERKRCYGCNYAVYCDNKCKLIAWRSHHWLECSMYDVLIKMRIESRIALRTVLNAAYSMYNDSDVNCEALHSIGESMSQSTSNNSKFGCHDSSKTKQMEYASDYWSLYCLQTHSQNQLTSTNCTNNNIEREVSRIVNILWDCFTWFDGIDKHEKTVNECEVKCSCNGETTNDVLHLLHLTFTKLSFSFYYSSDDFDILRWRKQVELACKSVSSTENKQQVSLRNIVDGIPKDCREMLRYLLVHHALQLRTNAQAIFKICSSPSPISNTNVEGTKQTRIATALFPVTSLMNHSCSPNTMVIFDGNNIKVIASRDIKEDEEIYHCYGPHCSRHSVGERQAILRDQYYFVCDCKSCIDEDGEEGSFFLQFHAFKCMFCSDPVKQDHASDGKERDNIRKCINTNCGKRQDLEKAKKVYMDSNIEYQDGCCLLEKNKIPSALSKLKASLLKKQSVLYHNHIDIGEVHDQIARCYVIQEKYHFAVQHLCKSIVIVGMLYGLRSLELARELQKLAPLYFNSGDFHSSGITARRALSILRIYYQSGPEIEEMETLLGVSGGK